MDTPVTITTDTPVHLNDVVRIDNDEDMTGEWKVIMTNNKNELRLVRKNTPFTKHAYTRDEIQTTKQNLIDIEASITDIEIVDQRRQVQHGEYVFNTKTCKPGVILDDPKGLSVWYTPETGDDDDDNEHDVVDERQHLVVLLFCGQDVPFDPQADYFGKSDLVMLCQ